MSVLLLGNTKPESQDWRILHRAESFEDMARQLDMFCGRSRYKAFYVISEKYYDYNTNTITNLKEALAETPSYMEEAFIGARYGRF